HAPIVVRASDVSTAATENHPSPRARTVRQAPLQAMLSPIARSVQGASTTTSRPASVVDASRTSPTAVMSPVNMRVGTATTVAESAARRRVDGHRVVAEGAMREDLPATRVCRRRLYGAERREGTGPEQDRRRKDNQPVDEPR